MNVRTKRLMSLLGRSLVAVTVAIAALTGAGWAALGKVDSNNVSNEARPRLLTVLTSPLVAEVGYSVERVFTGRVEAARSGAVGFELEGLVGRVLAEEGDSVAAGQLLATLDDARLQARRAELTAALEAARARLALARSTLRRIEGLVGRKHASQQELDEARENSRSLQAEVALAEARLDSIAVELDKTRLVAPFAAIVTGRRVDEGRVLSAGAPVLVLQDLAPREARIGVSRDLVATLVPGSPQRVKVGDVELSGMLRAVLPLQHGPTRSVDAILTLDADPATLRAGDLVRLHLSQPVVEPGFWVPLDALAEGERATWSVYLVVGEDGIARIERRGVELLHLKGDQAYVRGPLQAGQRLVSVGLHRVVPGQAVLAVDAATRLAAAGFATPAPRR